jgi:RNA processing factor Prp31
MQIDGVNLKSIGTLIDELSIINIRIWMMIDIIMGKDTRNHTQEEIINVAKEVQKLNAKRTKIIRAIDERLGDKDSTPAEKLYG